jgi:vacuolar iron transporter family protein
LNAERDAAAVYRALASRRNGEEREMFLALAQAEERHAQHWADLLDGDATEPHRLGLRARILSFLARGIGSLLVLALVQRAELAIVDESEHAPASINADERVHALVVAGLARRRRARASGTLRAAVFGANDGLVSNLSLVLGVAGAGVPPNVLLLTGLAGLLAGALSMAAGEYVSVRSQRELLESTAPALEPAEVAALRESDVHELALAFRAQGASPEQAERRAEQLLGDPSALESPADAEGEDLDVVGTPIGAAASSFGSFAVGALIPVLPFAIIEGTAALVTSALLAGTALFITGASSAILAGGPPLRRGMRQVAIGAVAAAATYALGALFGVSLA